MEEVIITLTKDEKNAISYFAEIEKMDMNEFIREAIFEKIRKKAPEFQQNSGKPIDTSVPYERMTEGFKRLGDGC